jgi:hypothetical protein
MMGALSIALAAGYLPLQGAVLQNPASYSETTSNQRAIVDKYCVRCHNERLKTAGLTLDKMDLGRVHEDAEVWERVVKKLRAGLMPPPGAPAPDKATHEALVAWLEETLDRGAAANPHPDGPIVHRLNRYEYTNAIRDLLALEVNGSSLLPADESGYGFDNIADVLSITPGLLERYLLAAQKISRLALGDPTMRPVHERFNISPHLPQLAREDDDLPFMSRGGAVIRHHFPLDGEYVLKIRLRKFFDGGTINGINTREQLDVRLDGTRLKLFSIGGECANSQEPKCIKSMGGLILPSSEYERTADEALEVRFLAGAGPRVIGIAFANRNKVKEGAGAELPKVRGSADLTDMGVDFVDLEGPFNASGAGDLPSRRKILVCQPTGTSDEELCAKKILTALARRAYRGLATDRDGESLLAFYRIGRNNGSFESGLQFALEKLLVSPKFLLRIEDVPSSTVTLRTASQLIEPGRLPLQRAGLEIASRMSFFLWSSIPDDQLLDVAVRGQLTDPKMMEQQVRRMLADRRASALVNNFASQWLYLRDLRKAEPDPVVFPDFDDNLREAFERETTLFLESQIHEDHPLVDLLTANYTFVNERLARFYGIPGVYGTHFRRVTLTDPNRAGLLGQGSILTVTSYSTRTSPVLRGKYLLSNILGSPPPPPPPNVEALPEPAGETARPTMRTRMEAHRKAAMCASCHARMDPLGFALENFDAIGRWRTTEGGSSIDSTGAFPDGTKINNAAEFREVLLGHRDEFVRTFTEKLLTYALGRGVEYYDMPAVRTIVRDAAPSDYRWSSVILGIVKSAPFQRSAVPDGRQVPLKQAN